MDHEELRSYTYVSELTFECLSEIQFYWATHWKRNGKFCCIAQKVKDKDKQGNPILIEGTQRKITLNVQGNFRNNCVEFEGWTCYNYFDPKQRKGNVELKTKLEDTEGRTILVAINFHVDSKKEQSILTKNLTKDFAARITSIWNENNQEIISEFLDAESLFLRFISKFRSKSVPFVPGKKNVKCSREARE